MDQGEDEFSLNISADSSWGEDGLPTTPHGKSRRFVRQSSPDGPDAKKTADGDIQSIWAQEAAAQRTAELMDRVRQRYEAGTHQQLKEQAEP